MKRLLAAAVMSTGALVTLPIVPSNATVLGSLAVTPAAGLDQSAMTVDTATPCRAPATNLEVKVSGHGMPPGQLVVSNSPLSAYPRNAQGGYTVAFSETMRDFAAQQSPPAVLAGPYEYTLTCRTATGLADLGDFSGAVEFAGGRYRVASTAGATSAAAPVTTSGPPATPPTSHATRARSAPAAPVSPSRPTRTPAAPAAARPTGQAPVTPGQHATHSLRSTSAAVTSSPGGPAPLSTPPRTSIDSSRVGSASETAVLASSSEGPTASSLPAVAQPLRRRHATAAVGPLAALAIVIVLLAAWALRRRRPASSGRSQ